MPLRHFFLFGSFFAALGIADALIWWRFGETPFGELFSLAELLWLALNIVALAIGWQQRRLMPPVISFVAYQLLVWFVGAQMASQSRAIGEVFAPPDDMLLAALVFYVTYFWLSHRSYLTAK